MPTGTNEYRGLAVPLHGESEITQRTLGTDILTITGVGSQTGDFLVLRNSSHTEKFVVDKDGDVSIAGTLTVAGELAMSAGQYLQFAAVTTAPTTGLTDGDLFIAMAASTPQIGICYSTAANSIRYITPLTKTFGRTTS
jgi:1-aminocyclopropane-1-carboxylate deaminase/D-cysteine desulfhydrase-like pyridoxal-dependent ACC family enzyme